MSIDVEVCGFIFLCSIQSISAHRDLTISVKTFITEDNNFIPYHTVPGPGAVDPQRGTEEGLDKVELTESFHLNEGSNMLNLSKN